MYGTLQKMELHLVAGFRIEIEHVLMPAINRHFHWQSNSGKTATDIVHALINTVLRNAAFAHLAATSGNGPNRRHASTVVEADLILANIHWLKKVWVFFFIGWFHGSTPFRKT